jgi:hypothetical protein
MTGGKHTCTTGSAFIACATDLHHPALADLLALYPCLLHDSLVNLIHVSGEDVTVENDEVSLESIGNLPQRAIEQCFALVSCASVKSAPFFESKPS